MLADVLGWSAACLLLPWRVARCVCPRGGTQVTRSSALRASRPIQLRFWQGRSTPKIYVHSVRVIYLSTKQCPPYVSLSLPRRGTERTSSSLCLLLLIPLVCVVESLEYGVLLIAAATALIEPEVRHKSLSHKSLSHTATVNTGLDRRPNSDRTLPYLTVTHRPPCSVTRSRITPTLSPRSHRHLTGTRLERLSLEERD